MSYIRAAWEHTYVDGHSTDYVFSTGDYIEDYGNISKEGIIELLFLHWETKDVMFKNHILKKLAKMLNVKLRDIPLTFEQVVEKTMQRMNQDKAN